MQQFEKQFENLDLQTQVVDGVIRRSGCEDKYRAMENCLALETNRDFRACAKVSQGQ